MRTAARGRLRVLTETPTKEALPPPLDQRTNDHRILLTAWQLAQEEPHRPVIVVSKDVNLRVKARTLGLQAEDYETSKIEDVEHLYRGCSNIELTSDDPIERLFTDDALPAEEIPGDFSREPLTSSCAAPPRAPWPA